MSILTYKHIHHIYTDRTSDTNDGGAAGGSSAQHVYAIHRSSDHVMANILPPDSGAWTRSGRESILCVT